MKSVPGLMVNMVIVRVQIPQFDVRNEVINTRKKGKATKLDFYIKNSLSVSWDIYRKIIIFLPSWRVSYLSAQSRKFAGDLQNEIGKNERETSAMEQLIKYFL